ncbi:MAG: HEAT repeat domain-containing protein [Planctomycetaceae bacterium]|nr:HEAT repeat domain-containing protein [Planctomycetaceae bacterium]
MNVIHWLVALAAATAPVTDSAPVGAPATHTVSLGSHQFTLPRGFDIVLAAGPPLIERPIHADFDDQGRLFVCESAGVNDKVEQQLAEKPHWILCLEDTDGDGRFDRRTKFADKMTFPEGMLCLDGSVYVAAPPSIWKLTDTDHDGVADRREEWFRGKTLTGCANDLHGPYEGPDGWIYWCKGAFAEQRYARPGQVPLVTRAAHIFRCRPDGAGVEPVMTGGMDNPVEVVFTSGGERIFTTTFLQHPGGGKRDGLIHAIYGGVYGKPHDVLDGHPRTGDLLPPLTHLGAAAPSGLARYESQVFGSDYQHNLFAALFNMHKVTRHVLTPAGATFAARDEDFVVSDSLDFHPTDVLEDADGSLLILDTGGWYKLCCPTSQLWKPEIVGGIYRIRRSGPRVVADPRGRDLSWETLAPGEMIQLLGDRRPAVVKRAIRQLGAQRDAAVAALAGAIDAAQPPPVRLGAVWALSRIDSAESRLLLRRALEDPDETVTQAAIHALSVARDASAQESLGRILTQAKSAPNRRAAAEALGRIGSPASVSLLLQVVGEESDRTLEHSLTYALIEIAAPAETRQGLASKSPRVRRAALMALDQMAGGGLEPEAVAALLTDPDAPLASAATWILGRHPEWSARLVPWLSRSLAAGALAGDHAGTYIELLAKFAHTLDVQDLVAGLLLAKDARPAERRSALQAMGQSGLPALPSIWSDAIATTIATNEELTPAAISVVRAIPKTAGDGQALAAALLAAARNDRLAVNVRLDALAAMPGGASQLAPQEFELVRENLSPDAQLSLRVAAAGVLAKARLEDQQLLALVDTVRGAGPLEIEGLLAPFAHTSDREVGLAVIEALAQCAALPNVRAETLAELFKNGQEVVKERSRRLHELQVAAAAERMAKIEDLLQRMPEGDVQRGQVVFNSQKAACASCHEIGYLGGEIGPDLTKIGQIRSDRDLLESIVFPSASFVRSYEPITVATTTGKTYSGLLRKDAPDEVVLALNAKETVRIPRDEIEQMAPAAVSIMPAGLDQQLSAQELIDLVTFLRACR